MGDYIGSVDLENLYLEHYGVKGMKWKYHKGKAVNGMSGYNVLRARTDVESLVDKAKLVGKKGSSAAKKEKAAKATKEKSGSSKAAKEPKEKTEKEAKTAEKGSIGKSIGMKPSKQYLEYLREQNRKLNASQLPKARKKAQELEDKKKKKTMTHYDDLEYIAELDLNEETLAHYGVKGMKWRHKKGRKKYSKSIKRRKKPIDPIGTGITNTVVSTSNKWKWDLYNNSETYRKYYNWVNNPQSMQVNAAEGHKPKYSQEELDYWAEHLDELDSGPADLQYKYEIHEELKKAGGKRRRKTNK